MPSRLSLVVQPLVQLVPGSNNTNREPFIIGLVIDLG
jgi:hypothetical protein